MGSLLIDADTGTLLSERPGRWAIGELGGPVTGGLPC
jgi:hypothetical protein